MKLSTIIRILTVFLLVSGCYKNRSVHLDLNEKPFSKLSEYQFFTGDLKSLTPNKGVLPYDVITPLFSDYAEKARFVWMPPNSMARIQNLEETFEFPLGAVLIKNFYYYNDFSNQEKGRLMVETRLLVNRSNGWDALTYVWNEDQSDAYLEIAGDAMEVSWIDHRGEPKNTTFIIPNKNQCKGCHEYKKTLTPIGPKVRHLNKEFVYPDGTANQLVRWQEVGYLRSLGQTTKELPSIANWADRQALIDDRALAYMEINCGICHGEYGPAYISGLYLHTETTDPDHLGICKSPVSAGSGSGGHKYDIVPGRPDKSILVYRMETLNPGEMMPELGRTMVHVEGVELIKEWIASLEGGCPESL